MTRDARRPNTLVLYFLREHRPLQGCDAILETHDLYNYDQNFVGRIMETAVEGISMACVIIEIAKEFSYAAVSCC
jgi:hypothetical protein